MKNSPIQHTLSSPTGPPPPSQNLLPPPGQLITPASTHQHPTNHIHDPNNQPQKRHAFLPHGQQDGFDIEFKEDAGDGSFVNRVRLGCGCILVRDDGVAGAVIRRERRVVWLMNCGRRWRRRAGVDCGDDGEVVLEFVEVGVCGCVGAVEGVQEGRVEGAEGEFVDDVGEVEGWI